MASEVTATGHDIKELQRAIYDNPRQHMIVIDATAQDYIHTGEVYDPNLHGRDVPRATKFRVRIAYKGEYHDAVVGAKEVVASIRHILKQFADMDRTLAAAYKKQKRIEKHKMLKNLRVEKKRVDNLIRNTERR